MSVKYSPHKESLVFLRQLQRKGEVDGPGKDAPSALIHSKAKDTVNCELWKLSLLHPGVLQGSMMEAERIERLVQISRHAAYAEIRFIPFGPTHRQTLVSME